MMSGIQIWMMKESNPSLAPAQLGGLGQKKRADIFAANNLVEHGLALTGRDDERDSDLDDERKQSIACARAAWRAWAEKACRHLRREQSRRARSCSHRAR